MILKKLTIVCFILTAWLGNYTFADTVDKSKTPRYVDEQQFEQILKNKDFKELKSLGGDVLAGNAVLTAKSNFIKAFNQETLAIVSEKEGDDLQAYLLLADPVFDLDLEDNFQNKYLWDIQFRKSFLAEKLNNRFIDLDLARSILRLSIRGLAHPEQLQSLVIYSICKKLTDEDVNLKFFLIDQDLKILLSELRLKRLNVKNYNYVYSGFSELTKLPESIILDEAKGDASRIYIDDTLIDYVDSYIQELKKGNLVDIRDAKLFFDILQTAGLRTKVSRDFMVKNETFLLKKYQDQEVSQTQAAILSGFIKEEEAWPFATPKGDVVKFIVEQVSKFSNPDSKYMLGMVMQDYYANSGQYDLAENEIDKLDKILRGSLRKKFGEDFYRGLSLVNTMFRFNLNYFRGDVLAAKNMIPNIDAELVWFSNDFIKRYPAQKSMYSSFNRYLNFRVFIGDPKPVIELTENLLQEIGGYSLEPKKYSDSRVTLLYVLEYAYKKDQNYKAASNANYWAFNNMLETGKFTVEEAFDNFYSAINHTKNYDWAQRSLDRVEKMLPNMSRSSDPQEYQAVAFQVLSAKKMLSLIRANPESHSELRALHCKDMSNEYDKFIDEKSSSKSTLEMRLSLFKNQYSVLRCAGDENYAAYYAKKYINELQGVRFNLSQDTSALSVFTESIADELKDFSAFFYDINDYSSSSIILRIVKENEFFDFVRRDSSLEKSVSFLRFSPAVSSLEDDISSVVLQINVLKKAINDATKNKNQREVEIYKKSLLLKRAELVVLRDKVRAEIKAEAIKSPVPDKLNLKAVSVSAADEALINFSINSDSIDVYVYTLNKASRYTSKVNRFKFRENILAIYSGLTKREKLNANLLKEISSSLHIADILALHNVGIKKINIRTSDILGMIPLSILGVNEKTLGEIFTIQFQGLGQNSPVNTSSNTLTVFGATKGSTKFSALPFVKDEVGFIGKIQGEKKKASIFLDKDFTRENLFKKFNSGSTYIHLATHFDPVPDKFSNGRLLMGDGSLLGLNDLSKGLNKTDGVKFVALSACETGIFHPGESMSKLEGLANIFVVNGAEKVLGTLWAVSDEATSDFMKIFYFFLRDTAPDQALFLTQKVFKSGDISALKESPNKEAISLANNLNEKIKKFSHPYYWAGFQIIGQ